MIAVLPVLLSCRSEKVEIGGSEDTAETDTPADTADTNTGDTGDTGEDDPGSPHAGVYEGAIRMEVPGWEWEVCAGALTLTVDAEAEVSGTSPCTNADSGSEYPVTFTGSIDKDGVLSGEVVMSYSGDGAEADYGDVLSGTVKADVITLTWQTHITDDPDNRGGITVEGSGEASRE